MAGIRSNKAWAAIAKQTGRGTPNTTMLFRSRLASDSKIQPRDEFAQFPETDSTRDAPNSEKMQGGAEGAFSFGVRDAFIHQALEAVLGTKVTTGTTNYTHTLSGADALSYYTIQQMLGDLLWEQAEDMIANELTVNVEAGGFMTAQISWMGRKWTRLTTEPAGLPAIQDGAVYNFNDAAVTIGGTASSLVRSMSLTLSNGLAYQQTDDFIPYDIHVGRREVTLGFDMIFENLDHYNQFHTGTTTGTAQSPTTFVTDALFSFSKGANNGIDFDIDALNWEEFPVNPDTGGDPLIVPVRARARRHASGLLRGIVRNQVAA